MQLGRQPSLSMLSHRDVQQAVRQFFSLKTDWPFRSSEPGRFGKYCLAEEDYREVTIPYEKLGCSPSIYETFFLSLESHFETAQDIQKAEALLEMRITDFVSICKAVSC